MSDETNPYPFTLNQNPAPNPVESGQDYEDEKTQLVQEIMAAFRGVLPSNYVAATNGPWYSLQFQAMAEQLADIQITSAEVMKDSNWDFTRPDFLWQMLGSYVFPGATDRSGIPEIDGDKTYRTFLKQMVLFLLQGSKTSSMAGGLEALDPNISVTILERYLETPPRDPEGAYTIIDQFTVDILVEQTGGGLPADPVTLENNAALVLAALKPAHVLYSYSYLLRDAFDQIADDTGGLSFDLDQYHYDDTRKWCRGAKRIAGSAGSVLSNRQLFSDPTRAFSSVRVGAELRILSGSNAGRYRVVETLSLPGGADPTPVAYTTSSGGSGTLTATAADVVADLSQDWGTMPRDTTLTISSGVNAGTYRLDTVLGPTGGPVGNAGVSGTSVRLSQSILKTERRMPETASSQSYEVTVDRLGVQVPRAVDSEDASEQFYL